MCLGFAIHTFLVWTSPFYFSLYLDSLLNTFVESRNFLINSAITIIFNVQCLFNRHTQKSYLFLWFPSFLLLDFLRVFPRLERLRCLRSSCVHFHSGLYPEDLEVMRMSLVLVRVRKCVGRYIVPTYCSSIVKMYGSQTLSECFSFFFLTI